MSALNSHRYWSRADAPGRLAITTALAGLKVGQRLRIADVLTTVPAAEGADGEAARESIPALVDYTSTAIRAEGVDQETREVELSFSSEQPYERWWGIEILGHKAGEVDMGWMASGRAPFLSNHDRDVQIGVLTRAWVDATTQRGRAVVRFGRSAVAEGEMQDAADGVRVNVSVGYEIRELELVKKDGDTPTYRVTDWLPLECSLVSIPADMTVGIGRTVEDTPAPPVRTISPQPRTEQTMPEAKDKPLAGDEQFRANMATISRLAAAYGKWLKPGDEARAIAEGDPQKFNELIMERMASGATDVTTTAALGLSQTEVRQYSFLRAVQALIPGSNVEAGFEREISGHIATLLGRAPEGIFIPGDTLAKGKRDFNVGTPAEAGNLVQTSVAADMFTDVLRPALVLAQLGIQILPGLRGNVAVPRKTAAGTLAALTEIQAASETAPATALVTLSPKRIGAYSEPSKQSIIQAEIGVEAMIRDDLVSGAAQMIENQGINGAGSGANARGIRNVSGIGSVVGGTDGAALAWSHITGLEAACANANATGTSRSGYLVNTKAVNKCKNTLKAAGLPFIWDGGAEPLNGYRAAVSNNVPSNLTKGTSAGICSSLVYSSDWSMFVLGLFGGQDVTVDPYTLATTGQVRITLNQWFDWICRQPSAFASMDDALTT